MSILDLGLLKTSEFTRGDVRKATEDLVNFGSKYYPDGTHLIFVINAPFVFRSVYAVVSPLFPEATRKKIFLLPKNYLDALGTYGIPKSSVPDIIGGEFHGIDAVDLALTVCPHLLDRQTSDDRFSAKSFAEAGDDLGRPPPLQRRRFSFCGTFLFCQPQRLLPPPPPPIVPRRSRDTDDVG